MNIWKRRYIFITIFIIALLLVPFIQKRTHLSQNKDGKISENGNKRLDYLVLPYTLDNPSKKYKLPHCLDEISGLSFLSKNILACIQDEKGILYIFDLEKGKVIEKLAFGEERDYEDIEIVKKNAYILQSNGTILKVRNIEDGTPKVKKYNTRLSKKNDAEGLAYDDESNALLIACKDSPALKKKGSTLNGKRAIYRFDLDTKEISKKPVCIIDLEDLKHPIGYFSNTKSLTGLIKRLNPLKGDINFCPSGIAIHPKTKNFYIISSVDKMLIVLNREGQVISSNKLNKKIFRQPEGICFNSDGDMFISNEKNGARANILMFSYKQ